ncbi:protein VASCULATURE COMPLEXITY AND CONNECTIVITY-like [Andrographis paniculata]|uniref:protein VASCULATURE COMPLEXITY AND CONNECTIVITY-like n=1 Tax=Andrographis paniculata TaxID=175694 RepID=UPI0021E97586|nr:protein VASCULATURE COMPLEXITY AND CONNECTIVITY-like [Andrographis paniculata]
MRNLYVGISLCILVIALDVTAGILGLKAEAAQDKEKHMRFLLLECKPPSHHAYELGFAAAVIFGVAHVFANLVGGCNFRHASKLPMVCLVLTWIVMAVGMSLLVIGTKSNHKSKVSCGLSHNNFLSGGGILCFIHAVISVAYYVTSSATYPK